jgi:hypothetical protein
VTIIAAFGRLPVMSFFRFPAHFLALANHIFLTAPFMQIAASVVQFSLESYAQPAAVRREEQ